MPETASLFTLSPPGLSGMVKLGRHLDALKRAGAIADWHPGRWESYKKERTGISFDSPDDAATAVKSWEGEANGDAPAPAQESAAAPAGSKALALA